MLGISRSPFPRRDQNDMSHRPQHAIDSGGDSLPARFLRGQLFLSASCQVVHARPAATVFRDPGRPDPAGFFHPVQRRVQGTLPRRGARRVTQREWRSSGHSRAGQAGATGASARAGRAIPAGYQAWASRTVQYSVISAPVRRLIKQNSSVQDSGPQDRCGTKIAGHRRPRVSSRSRDFEAVPLREPLMFLLSMSCGRTRSTQITWLRTRRIRFDRGMG